DSGHRTVWAWNFDPATGEIDNRRVFVRIAAADGVPDGPPSTARGSCGSRTGEAGASSATIPRVASPGRSCCRLRSRPVRCSAAPASTSCSSLRPQSDSARRRARRSRRPAASSLSRPGGRGCPRRASGVRRLLDNEFYHLRTATDARVHAGVLSTDRVDRREGGKAAQHTYGLFGCDPAHGANRVLRVVCGVRCDDDVVKLKKRVGRVPVSLLGRLLLDVVERRARNPSIGERLADCRVLDDRTARRVDEDGGRLHPPQRQPIEQVAGLRRKRRLNDEIVRGFDKPIEGAGPHILLLDRHRIEERVIRPDVDAEWPHAFRDAAGNGAEGYEAENAPTDAPDRLTRLPTPFASPDRPIVLADLAGRSEPERDGVVGNLLGTPLVRG